MSCPPLGATPLVSPTELPTPQPRQVTPKPTNPHKHHPQPFVRQNTVGSVMLAGVNIVSLVIDGKERLCLAQISNTLLKAYSYNEIHNRRVALGITCVQCTPVQLEILRRAGAMPVSSRRCGMITKREAERLVKSFLEDTCPPRLPDNFSFDVKHECGWGGRGSFIPSRYNSSRAKCIKCSFCNMFFSPNKFIFHYHRTPESKYSHPDAANFNSWRRHLKLFDDNASEDLLYAWEDVKAMFNGGSRKRVLSTHSHSSSHSSSSSSSQHSHSQPHPSRSPSSMSQPSPDYCKRPKMDSDRLPSPGRQMTPVSHSQPAQYPYPVFPVPNKVVPLKSVSAHPAFTVPFGYEKPLQAPDGQSVMKTNPSGPWPTSIPETYYPPYEMIWAKHLGLTAPETSFAHRSLTVGTHGESIVSPRGHHPALSPCSSRDGRQSVDTCGEESMRCHDVSDMTYHMAGIGDDHDRKRHLSAFKPVVNKSSHHEFDSCSERLREEMSEASTEADFREESEGESDNEDVDVDTVEEGVDFKTRIYKTGEQQEENNNDPNTKINDAQEEAGEDTGAKSVDEKHTFTTESYKLTSPEDVKSPRSPSSVTGNATSPTSHAQDIYDDQPKPGRTPDRSSFTHSPVSITYFISCAPQNKLSLQIDGDHQIRLLDDIE